MTIQILAFHSSKRKSCALFEKDIILIAFFYIDKKKKRSGKEEGKKTALSPICYVSLT